MSEEYKQAAMKWYYKPVWIVVAILAAGPFALPLVWLSPALKLWHKVLLTIAMVAVTVWMARATVDICRSIMKQMADLQGVLQ
jgi:hypothetical protein